MARAGHGGPRHRQLDGRRGLLHLPHAQGPAILSCSRPRAWSRTAVHVTRHEAQAKAWSARSCACGWPVNLSDAPAHPAFAYRPGNRRRPLSRLPGRAAAAGWSGHRRAGGPESHRALLWRGRGRRPADHRHGVGRNGRGVGEATPTVTSRAQGRRYSPRTKPDRIKGMRLAEGLAYGGCGVARAPGGGQRTAVGRRRRRGGAARSTPSIICRKPRSIP